jgi:hypothetical protein
LAKVLMQTAKMLIQISAELIEMKSYECNACGEENPKCVFCEKPCTKRLTCWDDVDEQVHICSEKCVIAHAKKCWEENSEDVLEREED